MGVRMGFYDRKLFEQIILHKRNYWFFFVGFGFKAEMKDPFHVDAYVFGKRNNSFF